MQPRAAGNEHRVHLRSINGQYLVAEQAGGGAVNANRPKALGWETFDLIDHNGGPLRSGDKVSLRTNDGIHYVAAEHNGGGAVNAHGTQAGPWETFTISKLSGAPLWGRQAEIKTGDKVSFRTYDKRHYLGAEHGGGGVVNAHGPKALEWETFTLEFVASPPPIATRPKRRPPVATTTKPKPTPPIATTTNPTPPIAATTQPKPRPPIATTTRPTPPPNPSSEKRVHLRSVNGQYVVAEQAGGGAVNANRAQALGWETFALIDHDGGALRSGDKVSLRTDDGRHHIAAELGGGGAVNAHGTQAGPWETFTVVKLSGRGVLGLWGQTAIGANDRVAFRTNDGRHYLGAEHGGGGVVNAHGTKPLEWETFTLEFASQGAPATAHPVPVPPRISGETPARQPAPQGPKPLATNHCVEDVPAAFERLQAYGDRLAVWDGNWKPHPKDHQTISGWEKIGTGVKGFVKGGKEGAKEEFKDEFSHMQGIQRLVGPYLAITGNSTHKQPGHVFIARLRPTAPDGRFQSNLGTSDGPPASDAVVHRIDLKIIDTYASPGSNHYKKLESDEQFTEDPKREYLHAGGLQTIGDYAAIALGHGQVRPGPSDCVERYGPYLGPCVEHELARVVFYDLSTPTSPRKLPYEIWVPRANSVAIAQASDGKYVLVVRLAKKTLYVYRSSSADLEDPRFGRPIEWNLDEQGLAPGSIDNKWRNYQNINLIRPCRGGLLYLIGLAKKPGGPKGNNRLKGDNWADLYEFNWGHRYGRLDSASLKKIGAKKIHCRGHCNFAAGGGIHVSDRGGLILYGVKHFISNGKIKAHESRSIPMRSLPVTDVAKAWVAIYNGKNFKGRSFVLEREDSSSGTWPDYKEGLGFDDNREGLGFDDKISSVRWQIPDGWSYYLFKKAQYKGESLALHGSGGVDEFFWLGGFDDAASSSRFLKTTITSPEEGWIELYAGENFTGRRMFLKGAGHPIADYKSLTVEDKQGFNNVVSSVRFQLPLGTDYRLYPEPNYEGIPFDLRGNGWVREWKFSEVPGWNNKLSSSR